MHSILNAVSSCTIQASVPNDAQMSAYLQRTEELARARIAQIPVNGILKLSWRELEVENGFARTVFILKNGEQQDEGVSCFSAVIAMTRMKAKRDYQLGSGSTKVVKLGIWCRYGQVGGWSAVSCVAVGITKRGRKNGLCERALHEAVILETMKNVEGVVQQHFFYDEKNDALKTTRVYQVMELCLSPIGHCFANYIESALFQATASDMQIYQMMRTMLKGVGVFHQRGMVHRDLKPENVLYSLDGSPKIADCEMAWREANLEIHPVAIGTALYEPPELAVLVLTGEAKRNVWKLRRSIGFHSDIWSLGIIFNILVSGERPFWAVPRKVSTKEILNQIAQLTPTDISTAASRSRRHPVFASLINKMLAIDYTKRPWIPDCVGELDAVFVPQRLLDIVPEEKDFVK